MADSPKGCVAVICGSLGAAEQIVDVVHGAAGHGIRIRREHVRSAGVVLVLRGNADDRVGEMVIVPFLEIVVTAEHLLRRMAGGGGFVAWIPAHDSGLILVFRNNDFRSDAELRDDADVQFGAFVQEVAVAVVVLLRAENADMDGIVTM